MKNKTKVKLPKNFGKMPELPKLSPELLEIFSKPIDPEQKLPKYFLLTPVDPTCTFYPKGQCERPYNEINACWKCGQEIVKELQDEIKYLEWKIKKLNANEISR